MKDIKLNPLNSNLRKLLQFGAALILVVFLIIYFIFLSKGQNKIKNNTVYLQNGKLQIFDDSVTFNQFPDKIAFHYPYFVVVKPTLKTTYIYNLENKKKEKEVKEITLDYYKGNILSNRGATTFYNKQDLGLLCEKAFIKSQNEVLCVTKQYTNYADNKLISINIKTKEQKDIYTSKNLITDVSIIGNSIYYGEIDLYTNKNYIYVNKEKIETPNIISLIYQINGKPYFASFKSALNNQKESYYLIENKKVLKQEDGKILLYK